MIFLEYVLIGFLCSALLIAVAKGFMGKMLHKDENYYEQLRMKKERGDDDE